MSRARGPLFLKRGSYRQRRLRDAARMLPFVGMLLFLMPVLWAQGDGTRDGTATDGIYLFAVWIGLVVLAAAMAPGLSSDPSSGLDDAEDAGPGAAAEVDAAAMGRRGGAGTGEG